MEFQYIVQRPVKGKVCFGSGLERMLFNSEKHGLVSRHGIHLAKENLKNIGPGSYNPRPIKCERGKIWKKKSPYPSIVPRLSDSPSDSSTPGPIYNLPTAIPTTFKQSCAPFNVSQARFHYRVTDYPGVGTYNVDNYRRRRVAFAQSFGGNKCLIPVVKMKCDPYKFDVCEICGNRPEGDYWFTDLTETGTSIGFGAKTKTNRVYVCRQCFETEKKTHKSFTKGQIKNFRKIRDCSTVHYHGGCNATILLVYPKETAKLKEREGYFSLYFS